MSKRADEMPGPSKDGFRVLMRRIKNLELKKEVCGCIGKSSPGKL